MEYSKKFALRWGLWAPLLPSSATVIEGIHYLDICWIHMVTIFK